MSVKRKRNPLWAYFTETPGKNEASCSMCNESIKTSGNTTNMSKHLKLKHAAEYDVALKGGDELSAKKPPLRKQSSLDSSFTLQRTRSMDTALVRGVALDLQPLSVVENKGFRDFVHELNPSYGLPSRRTLSNRLEEFYADSKKKVHTVVKEKGRFFALTTDFWTSRTTDSYLTVTCHFATADFVICTSSLDTVCLQSAHTSHNIAEILNAVAKKWGISRQSLPWLQTTAQILCLPLLSAGGGTSLVLDILLIL